MIDTIFWDNDGVLVDTEKFYFQATREVLAEQGVQFSARDFADNLLLSSKGAWHLVRPAPDKSKIDELRKKRDAIYLSLLKSSNPTIDGAGQVLSELSAYCKMAIATSSKKEHFLAVHQKTGFLKYIDFYLAREDYPDSKPDPCPYIKALKISGGVKSRCLVIEDSQRGLTAAKRAGLSCWIVESGFSSFQDFSQADRIIASIKEIPELIREINSKV